MKKATTKIRMPRTANTSALTTLSQGSVISLTSCVMVIAAIDRTIRAGIVPNGHWRVLDLGDRCKAEAAPGSKPEEQYRRDSVNQINPVPDHWPPPKAFIGWSLSAQRICSKL